MTQIYHPSLIFLSRFRVCLLPNSHRVALCLAFLHLTLLSTSLPLFVSLLVYSTDNMELDPGWLVLALFMLIEGFLVILMILPVPSNDARRFIRDMVAGLWDSKPIQYFSIAFLLLDAFYFWFVSHALLHPLYDFGILTPIDMAPTCEVKQAMYREERNAFISGMGLFLFFVLNRLVDIQDKLHQARDAEKRAQVREQTSKKDD